MRILFWNKRIQEPGVAQSKQRARTRTHKCTQTRTHVHTQVRRDNPRLTTRREGGHAPVRVVMSRTLDLPEVRAPKKRVLPNGVCSHLVPHLCVG